MAGLVPLSVMAGLVPLSVMAGRGDEALLRADVPAIPLSSWPGLSRPSTPCFCCAKNVDGRDQPGHDERKWLMSVSILLIASSPSFVRRMLSVLDAATLNPPTKQIGAAAMSQRE